MATGSSDRRLIRVHGEMRARARRSKKGKTGEVLEPGGGLIVELKCWLLLGDEYRPQTQRPKRSCFYRWETDSFFSGFLANKNDKMIN